MKMMWMLWQLVQHGELEDTRKGLYHHLLRGALIRGFATNLDAHMDLLVSTSILLHFIQRLSPLSIKVSFGALGPFSAPTLLTTAVKRIGQPAMKRAAKVQTQLTFKNHSGNTTAFQQQVLVQKEAKALNDSRKCLRSGKNKESIALYTISPAISKMRRN